MYLVTYDIGNSFIKATLTKIANSIEFVGATVVSTHSTSTLGGKGVEQSTEQWWDSICRSTKDLLKNYGITSDQIKGISFCSQMNATILVDDDGNAVRPPMTFLDRRADKEFKGYFNHGLKIHGLNIWKLIKAMHHTSMVPVGAYSPIWKYKWVQTTSPKILQKSTSSWTSVTTSCTRQQAGLYAPKIPLFAQRLTIAAKAIPAGATPWLKRTASTKSTCQRLCKAQTLSAVLQPLPPNRWAWKRAHQSSLEAEMSPWSQSVVATPKTILPAFTAELQDPSAPLSITLSSLQIS